MKRKFFFSYYFIVILGLIFLITIPIVEMLYIIPFHGKAEKLSFFILVLATVIATTKFVGKKTAKE